MSMSWRSGAFSARPASGLVQSDTKTPQCPLCGTAGSGQSCRRLALAALDDVHEVDRVGADKEHAVPAFQLVAFLQEHEGEERCSREDGHENVSIGSAVHVQRMHCRRDPENPEDI